jgi:hypothetical protein
MLNPSLNIVLPDGSPSVFSFPPQFDYGIFPSYYQKISGSRKEMAGVRRMQLSIFVVNLYTACGQAWG